MAKKKFSTSDEILNRCHERAAMYDRENKFAQEDFDELKEAGYLLMSTPKEFGGYGMSLHEVSLETRRLAYHAPATALMRRLPSSRLPSKGCRDPCRHAPRCR